MPKDLRLFATKVRPLHPSGLRELVLCPWRSASLFLEDAGDSDDNVAANTGSAMHKAAAAMHRGKEVSECLRTMGEHIGEYPQADLADASALFLNYAADPRNRDAKLVLVEEAIAFSIKAADFDPTQEPIEVIGTVDQVREKDGRLYVWDIKTTKKDPLNALHKAAFQAAAYCIGASVKLGKQVEPGGLILPRRYTSPLNEARVFYHFPWTFADIEQILSAVRNQVAMIRSGNVHHMPNDDSFWCHHRTPDVCLPRLLQIGTAK